MRDIRADLRERLAAVAGTYADEMADFDRDIEALQARHRETVAALERERAALEQLLAIEDQRAGAEGADGKDGRPVSSPRLVPLADFLVTKAHAHGPVSKEELRAEANLAGYFRNGDGRTFHTTLMNVRRHGRLIQLSDGRYAFPQRGRAQVLGMEQPSTDEATAVGTVAASG